MTHKYYYFSPISKILLGLLFGLLVYSMITNSIIGSLGSFLFIMPSAIYLFKSLRAHTGLIVEDNKVILYEQKFFEIKRVIYSTKTILSYGVVDKKITAVRSRAYGGRAMPTMSFTSSKSSYKKKVLVVKTKKTCTLLG